MDQYDLQQLKALDSLVFCSEFRSYGGVCDGKSHALPLGRSSALSGDGFAGRVLHHFVSTWRAAPIRALLQRHVNVAVGSQEAARAIGCSEIIPITVLCRRLPFP